MSDFENSQKLVVVDTIKDGVSIGMKNIVPILVNIILYALTAWIPYLNVGTTIGLFVGIVSKASKGEPIPMTEIFDPKYRRYMGEFFLTAGLMSMGISIAMLFLVIPGIVVGLAWSLALMLCVDKGKNPTEAIALSNKCTYGYKFKMVCIYFVANLLLSIALAIPIGIIGAIIADSGNFILFALMGLIIAGGVLFGCFVNIGLQASIYRQLTNDISEDIQNQVPVQRAPVAPAPVQPAPAQAASVAPQPQQPQVQTPTSQPQPQAITMRMEALRPASMTYGSDFGYEQPKSKTPLIIGIAAGAVLVIAGVVVFLMMSPNASNSFEMGKLHYDANNHTEAVNFFTQAINKNPRDANFYNYRGRSNFELGNHDAALTDFAEAARLAPNVADNHFRLGETYAAMKNHTQAVAAYSEAIRIDPNNADYYFRRGDANNANNALAASLDDYSQAIRIDPSDARFWNNRGGTHRQMENYNEAIIDYNEAIRLNPSDARYRNNRGVANHLARNHPAAIADYSSAIQLAPDNARYRNNRGQVHNLMRNYAEAVEDFRMASELAPDNNQYRRDLEQAQERLSRQIQQQWQRGGW